MCDGVLIRSISPFELTGRTASYGVSVAADLANAHALIQSSGVVIWEELRGTSLFTSTLAALGRAGCNCEQDQHTHREFRQELALHVIPRRNALN